MAEEPRIMFVTRKWAPAVGGMETYSMRLTEALSAIEPVEVVALPGRANGMPPSAWALIAFPVTVLTRFFARQTPPKVLHLGDMAIWPLGLLAWLGGGKTRIVLTAHGTDVAYHRRGGIKGRLYGAYMRLGSRFLKQAKIIANSRATAEALRETGWEDSTVIPLATDLKGPAPDGTHNGRILFVGRLIERKGCGWFVREVLPQLPEDIVLDVAGPGWDESERGMLDDPRVNYLGNLHGENLASAYREALCVIVPNIATSSGEYEGFGLVAPEAAACGGLVLAADRDGLRDALIDGETGTLVASGDAWIWADRVVHVTQMTLHERQRTLAHAQVLARQHYDWNRVAHDTISEMFRC